MDLESKKGSAAGGRRKRRGRGKWWVWVVAAILAVGLLFLVLGLTVFKAKRATTTVDSVSLRDLDVSVDILRLKVVVNVSLDARLSITNPNRVSFHFGNTSALLRYRQQVVGEVPIPAGYIGARQTLPMNITLTIMADRLLSDSNLYSDITSGTLPLTTYTRVSGYVRILFKIHLVSYTTCDLFLDVSSRTIANQTCHYKTKL